MNRILLAAALSTLAPLAHAADCASAKRILGNAQARGARVQRSAAQPLAGAFRMTIDPTEAARIAKGLTKGQRHVLNYLTADTAPWSLARKGAFSATSAWSLSMGKFRRPPLVEQEWPRGHEVMAFRLTPLGLAVAEALNPETSA